MIIWEKLKKYNADDFKGEGLKIGDSIYVLDIDDYLKMKAEKLSVGTILKVNSLTSPTAAAKWGQDGIYRVRITSIDEMARLLLEYISKADMRYVMINEPAYYKTFVYDKEKDCFFMDKYMLHDYYWDSTYGNTLFKSNGTCCYAVSPDHKIIMFSMSNVLNLMTKATSLDDAISNLKTNYIYESKFKEAPIKHGIKNLDCYSRPPKIVFNSLSGTSKKWFSFIRCEAYIVSRCATKEYLEENRKKIYKDLAKRIQSEKRFIKAGIPIGCFKVGGAVLTADNIFIVTFQLKMETEDDIDG